ncbi:MAG: hypothetical protein A3E09_01210 [Candidatus Liptonbacteria bacterium RIFCSPHIGHO2_12_FULL_60_13]|uniref:Uncharacterized protein n=1 Tax=Candidatus Liptonbacteria bacterium RIFCSPHIGHO2_12_FULL_60_13 TaxID=1798648 RepID=A0A1G2CDT0_9BACT|nr:MAG: hypothetical protein A3E09_01210 [Candidatus Liptonbacteria bacterium RIFCSPHIGHO2_12_FULL_60_13]
MKLEGAKCLGGVFDDEELMLMRDTVDGAHIRHLTVEMNGHYGARSFCYSLFYFVGVNIECKRIDICKNRFCSGMCDNFSGGNERKRGCYYFITLTDAKRFERKKKCIGAGVNSYRVRNFA